MKLIAVAAVAGTLALGAFVHAYRPAGETAIAAGGQQAQDLASVDRQHFYDVVVPRARQEDSVNLYSFAAAFPPFWKNIVIPRFEKQYGIKVNFYNTRPDLADQQLIALHTLGRTPPADVYFAPRGHVGLYRREGLAAGFNLAALLPEAAAYPAARFDHVARDGRFAPFHLNQAALAYDSARLPADQLPRDLDALLAWARAHPGQFALTSPKSGGSGEGFLLAVANRFTSAACRQPLMNEHASAEDTRRWIDASGCLTQTWRYLRALDAVSVITNGNADTQNLLANQAVTIGTVWEDWAYTFVKAKLLQPSVRLTVLDSGMPGSADVLFVVAGAAHPAAALLLIDFALSRPIQQWKLDEMASRTGRTDLDSARAAASPSASFMIPADAPKPALSWPSTPVMTALDDAFVAHVVEQR